MTRLLLVKHALPEIRPEVSSKRWLLGDVGRQQSLHMAEQLRSYHPDVVVASEEPKATETGKIVAEILDLPFRTAPGLYENDRTGVPYFKNLADLETAVQTFFGRPDEQVFGAESANGARERFVKAVQRVLKLHSTQTVALVAHGTVNTLFVATHNTITPFELWQAWPLGAFAVLSRPDFRLLEHPSASVR